MRALRVSALLLLAATALAAPAQGALTISYVQPPAAPLVPEVDQGLVEVTVEVDCTDAFPQGTVHYEFQAFPGVQLTGPMSQSFQCQTPMGRTSVVSQFQVAVTRDAPGLTLLPIEVGAYTDFSTLSQVNGGPGQDESQFTVVAAPFLLTQAQAVERIVTCDCRTATVAIHLENLGNVRAVQGFKLMQASRDDARILLPEALVLDSPLSGGRTNATALIQVDVPESGELAFQVQVDSAAALDPAAQGQPSVLNFLVRRGTDALAPDADDVKEGVADIPAAGPLLPLLALGAGLVALRRRA